MAYDEDVGFSLARAEVAPQRKDLTHGSSYP